MSPDVTLPPRPSTGRRIVALDVLRGLAVLGIVVVNVEQLFIPTYLANEPVAVRPGEPGMLVAWFITDAFFESKFLTIFSLLFGAGFCLQFARYLAAGKAFVALYLRRIVVLVAFGLLHATFFYFADVLVLYGLTALVLLLFRHRSARAMIRTGIIMLTLMTLWHILLSGPEPNAEEDYSKVVQNLQTIHGDGTVTIADRLYTLPVPDSLVASHLNGDIHSVDEATAQALAFGQGPARLAIRARLVLFNKFITLFTPLFLLWRTLGVFLIAAGLVKLNFLDTGSRATWRRTAIVGFAVGLPVTLVASALRLVAYQSPGVLTYVGSALHDVSALLLAAAISSLVLIVASRGLLNWLGRGLESVGRLALTNYIFQSVLLTFIATSIGLGLFGRLGRLEILLLCLPVFAVEMASSALWTRYFRMGPLEWIWRGVTYRRFPQNRIRSSGSQHRDA